MATSKEPTLLDELRYREIETFLKCAKDYLREDVPSYIKLMF